MAPYTKRRGWTASIPNRRPLQPQSAMYTRPWGKRPQAEEHPIGWNPFAPPPKIEPGGNRDFAEPLVSDPASTDSSRARPLSQLDEDTQELLKVLEAGLTIAIAATFIIRAIWSEVRKSSRYRNSQRHRSSNFKLSFNPNLDEHNKVEGSLVANHVVQGGILMAVVGLLVAGLLKWQPWTRT